MAHDSIEKRASQRDALIAIGLDYQFGQRPSRDWRLSFMSGSLGGVLVSSDTSLKPLTGITMSWLRSTVIRPSNHVHEQHALKRSKSVDILNQGRNITQCMVPWVGAIIEPKLPHQFAIDSGSLFSGSVYLLAQIKHCVSQELIHGFPGPWSSLSQFRIEPAGTNISYLEPNVFCMDPG